MLQSTRNRLRVGGDGRCGPVGARRKEKQKEEQDRRMVQEEMVLRLQVWYCQMTAAAGSRSGRRPIGVSEDVIVSTPTTAWSKAVYL